MEPSSVLATLFMKFQESISQALERNFQNQSTISQRAKGKKNTLSRNEQILDGLDKTLWMNFPRRTSFYEPTLISFAKLANSNATILDNIVQLFLYWLPLHSQAYAQMHDSERVQYPIIEIYGYDYFIAKLKNFEPYDQRQSDLAECVIDLVVADALAAVLQFFSGNNLSGEVINKLLDLCFYYFKPRDPKWAMHSTLWYSIRGVITQQWCAILSILTRCNSPHIDRVELLKTAMSCNNVEEQAAYFKGLRWTMLVTSTASGIQQSEAFIDTLVAAIEDKKKQNKHLILEILDATLETIDFSDMLEGIASKAKDIFKKAAKWLKIDDLGYTAKRLMGTILSRAPSSFFEAEIDAFLTKKVIKGVWSSNQKKRDSNLEALLRILRGKYMSERAPWLPKADRLFPPTPLPYSHVPFAYNPSKMVERLKNIVIGLFSKKTPVIKSIDGLDICVDIVVQIAAHSMTLMRDFLIPMLLSDKTTIMLHQLIGLRAIRVIFDIASGFWVEVPCNTGNNKLAQAGYNKQDHVVPRDALEKIFEDRLMKLLVAAESSAGFSACGRDGNPLKITTSMKQSDITLREFEVTDDNPTNKILSEATKDSITRWYEVVSKTPDKREKSLIEKLKNMDKRVTETVRIWCSHSLVPTRGLVDLPIERPDDKRKKAVPQIAAEKNISLELYKEDIRCIPLILPADIVRLFSTSSFFGQLVVHNDNELATICSHSLQRIMHENPKHRTAILKGMIALVQQYHYEETLGLQVVLGQLSVLLDFWNYLKYDSSAAKADPNNDPDQSLIDEIYTVAMVHMCHPDCEIRHLSFQIINATNSLKPASQPSFATLINLHDSEIVEQARYRFLLNGAHGIDTVRVYEGQSSKNITIREAVASQQLVLWQYILAEIGKCFVEHGANLAMLRENLLVHLNSLTAAPQDASNEASFNHDYRVVRRNYAALLFAVSSPSTNEFQNKDYLQWQAKFIESFTSSKSTGLLSSLHSDIDWVRDAIILGCGGSHWHGYDVIINGLNNWFSNLKKKEKPKVKPWIAAILRQISQEAEFTKALHKFDGISVVYLQFANELESIFGTLPKINNEYFFIDSILVIKNFCTAIYKNQYCARKGPIRLYLIKSTPPGAEWAEADRLKIFKLLLAWYYDVQKEETQQEIVKHLAKIKEQAKKDEKKKEYDRAIRDVCSCVRYVVESLSRVGGIFPEDMRSTIKDHLEFFVQAEQKGHSINRWILSYQFPDVLGLYIDQSYSRSVEESPLFIHPIADQYLPIVDHKVPSNGIASELKNYFFELGKEQTESKKMETSPLTKEDELFAQQTFHNAGPLLHFAFFNLIHPNANIRARCVDFLARLVPNKFGSEQQQENSTISDLRVRLAMYSGLAPQILPKARPNAIEISQITSKYVPTLTEALFKEAVHRLVGKTMTNMNKTWIIDFLLPWCDNIQLGTKSNLKSYNSETFLEAIYTNFVLDMVGDDVDIPSSLVLLWQALAQVSSENLTTIINYLLRKATSSARHLSVCKSLILYIYRKDAPPTLSPLLSHFQITSGTEEDPLAPKEEKKEEGDAGKKLRENFQLREAAIIILHDLITDNVQPLIPHLYVLLSYTLLKGNSTESKSLSRLLIAITNAIHNLLLARRTQQEGLLSALKMLEASMDVPSFRVKWNYAKYAKESTWASKVVDTTLASGVNESSQELAVELAHCFGEPIDANKVIIIFCDSLQHIAPELLERWASSSLHHAVTNKDPQLAIMAHQMFRAIGSTIDQECINKLLSSLLDSIEKMETFLEKTISLAKDPKQTASKRFATNETIIQIFRGKALEVLLTLQTIVPAVTEVTTLRLIFWTAVTFLRSPHPPFAHLYYQALQLLQIISERDILMKADASFGVTSQLISKIQGVPFKGLQPWLFQGLSLKSTEKLAATLLASFIKVPLDFIIHDSPIRLPLTVIGLLPWIHAGISSTIGIDSLYYETITIVVENLGDKLPQTSAALKSVLNNTLLEPDDILSPVCDELYSKCFPAHAAEIAEVLSNIMKCNSKFLNSVLLITKLFLSNSNAVDFVQVFQDQIKAATEKLTSLRSATDVLLLATKLLHEKYPDSTLHNKIKPLTFTQQAPMGVKFSSMTIRQLMSTEGNFLPPPSTGPKRIVTPRGSKPSASFTKGSAITNPTLNAATPKVSKPAPSPKIIRNETPTKIPATSATAPPPPPSAVPMKAPTEDTQSEDFGTDDDFDISDLDSSETLTPRRQAEIDLRNLAADIDLPSDFGEYEGDTPDLGDVTANLDVNFNELSSALSVLEKYM